MSGITRRLWLKRFVALASVQPVAGLNALAATPELATDPVVYPTVEPRPLAFPRDFGAHPAYRTEWWYLTGWLDSGQQPIGFQVTFFRSRTRHPTENPSRFAPQQLMFAHAALALPDEGQLRHSEISGRVGPAGIGFSTADTHLKMSDWQLRRTPTDRYEVFIPADDFTLSLEAQPTGEPVLRGQAGYSLKGPSPELASYYYSRPQMRVSAQVTLKDRASATPADSKPLDLTGTAWFDHEWSSSLLMKDAVGWDWIGINLFDGSSLMAFRIRNAEGQTLFSEWDWRDAQGQPIEEQANADTSLQTSPQGLPQWLPQWLPFGRWQSPHSLVTYPEGFTLKTPTREWQLKPLMADQEVDARASTGGFYYEGAVELIENGRVIGRGYLELTGYGEPLRL